MKLKTLIIAEAGVNHDGDVGKAKALIDVACEAGADVVKFQTFKAEKLVTKDASKAEYQKKQDGHGSQFEMLKSLELSYEEFRRLRDHALKMDIELMSSPFDEESLDFLVSDLKVQRLKFGSGELTNSPLLYRAALSGLPMICSTGMSDVDDIARALSFIAQGYLGAEPYLLSDSDQKLWLEKDEVKKVLQQKLALLHCTTEYPAPWDSLHISAIGTLKSKFGLDVGFSDHTPGTAASVAAVALGARVIEKHFTLDPHAPGPDHKASLCPDELKRLVQEIRHVELGLGNGEKQAQSAEMGNRKVARKSLVAEQAIEKGAIFGAHHITCKRPGNGLAPSQYWNLLGRVAQRSYEPDELISLEEAGPDRV